MLNINENVTLRGSITIQETDGSNTVVLNVSANLNRDTHACNIQYDTINNTLLVENTIEVQTQLDEFKATVKAKSQELGYIVFI